MDKSLIRLLLNEFKNVDEWYYTHRLSFCASSFMGKSNRPSLRKYLRFCESKGYVKNINKGHNMHMWKITQEGIDFNQLLLSDSFISLI